MTPQRWTPDTKLDAPGVWTGVPEHVYHAVRMCSSSNLRNLVQRSPYAAKKLMDVRVPELPNESMRLGTAMHCALLQPEEFGHLVDTVPSFRAKASKIRARELMEAGGVAVSEKEYPKAFALHARQGVPDIAQDALSALEYTELTVIEEMDGVLVKARLDGLGIHAGVILDVKTGQVDAHSMSGKLWSYGYGLQFALYHDIAVSALDIPRDLRFLVLTVCQDFPVEAALYHVPEEELEDGRKRYRAAMSRWSECERTGVWPYAQEEIKELRSPSWVASALEEEVGA